MRKRSYILFFTVGILLASSNAIAKEPPTDPTIEEAKRLFSQAIEELDAGRADIGRDLLRRSIALHPTRGTRYNLGVALQRTGQTTEALAMFEGLLREPTLSAEKRADLEEQIKTARAELATVTVIVTGSKEATVEIDGREVGITSANEPSAFKLDAGKHVIVARAGGSTRQQIDVARGQAATVTLHVLSLAEQNAEQRKQRRKKRAAWIAGSTAVVAAIVVGAVLGTRSSKETEPVDGNIPTIPVTATLRLAR